MAFHRSREGPMEFEYERQPFFSYNVFNVPPRDQDIVMADPIDLAHKPPKTTTINPNNFPALDEVSNDFGGINLNDRPEKDPELIHREIQTEDDIAPSDSLSSPPQTPPATTPDMPVVPNSAHELTHPPPSSSQHLHHHHIYPSLQREDFSNMAKSLISIGCDLAWFTMFVYIFVQFALALKKDVNLKLMAFESDRLDEFLECQMQYANNRCDPSTRVPAMDELCRQWQKCLRRPMWNGTTRAFAETLADVINGFVDHISLKSMSFVLFIVAVTLWAKTYTGSSKPSEPGAYPVYPKPHDERKQIMWSG